MNELSLSQKQIILGGLLGDSSFNKEKQYVVFSQSEKQKEYVEWKYSWFKIKNEIKSVYNKIGDKKYLRYYFYLYRKDMEDGFISFIFKNLYSNNGRKKISLQYLNKIESLGLAVWWMDDGNISLSKDNRYGKLSTHCFNYEEHILIQKYFKNKWNIDVSIKMEKDLYFIRFNVTELKKLISIIYKHIAEIPNMLYKVDLNYKYNKCIGEDFISIYTFIKENKNS